MVYARGGATKYKVSSPVTRPAARANAQTPAAVSVSWTSLCASMEALRRLRENYPRERAFKTVSKRLVPARGMPGNQFLIRIRIYLPSNINQDNYHLCKAMETPLARLPDEAADRVAVEKSVQCDLQ